MNYYRKLSLRNDLLLLQTLKAQEATRSETEDKDDMDITDGGGKKTYIFPACLCAPSLLSPNHIVLILM